MNYLLNMINIIFVLKTFMLVSMIYYINTNNSQYFLKLYYVLNKYFFSHTTPLQIENNNINDANTHTKLNINLKYEEKYIKELQLLSIFELEEKTIKELNNTFVMEMTPLGNVLMTYDFKRESFTYYSDNTIPYRFLETIARKYVKQFNCKILFIDLAEEFKLAKERILANMAGNGESKEGSEKVPSANVFAKLKNYNKLNTNSHNLSKQSQISKNINITIKEKTNRYTYEGKLANFSFLKKVDKKLVDKKYTLKFSDFKKITQCNIDE